MQQKGKAPSRRQRWKSTDPGPVGGNQPSLPPAIDVSALNAHLRKSFSSLSVSVPPEVQTLPLIRNKSSQSTHLCLTKQPSFRNSPCTEAHLLRGAFVTCGTTAAGIIGTQNPFGRICGAGNAPLNPSPLQLATNKTRAQPVQKSKLEVKQLKAPNLTLPIPFTGIQKRTPAWKLRYQHQLLTLSSGKCCCSLVTPLDMSRSPIPLAAVDD